MDIVNPLPNIPFQVFVGMPVVFRQPFERTIDIEIPAGSTGVVSDISEDGSVWVKLTTTPIQGLEQWKNEVQLTPYDAIEIGVAMAVGSPEKVHDARKPDVSSPDDVPAGLVTLLSQLYFNVEVIEKQLHTRSPSERDWLSYLSSIGVVEDDILTQAKLTPVGYEIVEKMKRHVAKLLGDVPKS